MRWYSTMRRVCSCADSPEYSAMMASKIFCSTMCWAKAVDPSRKANTNVGIRMATERNSRMRTAQLLQFSAFNCLSEKVHPAEEFSGGSDASVPGIASFGRGRARPLPNFSQVMKYLPQIDAFSTIPSHDESHLRAQSTRAGTLPSHFST